MIVFGICAGPGGRLERMALPSIERTREESSEVIVLRDQSSIGSAYNSILDHAAARPDVEAVIFLHDDVRILDPDACAAVRAAVAQPDVAIVGVIGCRNPMRMSWSSGTGFGQVVEASEHGEVRREMRADLSDETHDVDMVDGLFMAFSPWAIVNLRFDTRRFPHFDGYDADVCAQGRSMGKRVLTTSISIEHVCIDPAKPYTFRSAYPRAALAWKAKWRVDQPRSRRAWWGLRARFLPIKSPLHGTEWRS